MPRFEDLAAEGQALVEVGGAVVGVDVATQAELDSHATDTTDVHGIADTAALATQTYVDTAVDNATSLPQAYTSALATDYNSTAAVYTAFHSGSFTAQATEIEFHVSVGAATTTSFNRLQFAVNGVTYKLGYIDLNGGLARTVRISGLTVGTVYNWSVTHKNNTSSTFYCRAATQEAEYAEVIATPAS